MSPRSNKKVIGAISKRDDEFYTLDGDVESEMSHYDFRGLRVYCPCDSPDSAFVKYFKGNFERLGLRLFSHGWITPDKTAFTCTFDGKTETTVPNTAEGFASAASTEVLRGSDIVVTNPPFSLNIEFFKWLFSNGGNDRRFIVVSNVITVQLKVVFERYVKNGQRIWGGFEKVTAFMEPGGRLVSPGNTIWLQNVRENFPRKRSFTGGVDASSLPKYRGVDVLFVDKVKNIPTDYTGMLGVPVSFLLYSEARNYDVVSADGSGIYASYLLRLRTEDDVNRFTRLVVKRRSTELIRP